MYGAYALIPVAGDTFDVYVFMERLLGPIFDPVVWPYVCAFTDRACGVSDVTFHSSSFAHVVLGSAYGG